MEQTPSANAPRASTCPRCGVTVSPGYTRCPRCRNVIPGAPSNGVPQAHLRSYHSGGTTLARPHRLPLVIAAAAGGAAVIAVLVMVLSGGKPSPAPAGDAGQTAGVEEAAAPGEGDEPQAQSDENERFDQEEPADEQASVADAVRELAASLRSERLWSTVTIDRTSPDVVIIQSSLCDDGGLEEIVTGALSQMKSHGVAAVRCVAPHGGVIFEKTP